MAVVVLAACGGDDGEPDASAKLACRDFRNVAADVSAGIVADSELRGKMQIIHENAEVSEEPGIASNATAMLAAATDFDDDELARAVTAFGSACEDLGL